MTYCITCGKPHPPNATFCPSCGTSIQQQVTPAAPQPVRPQPQPVAPYPPQQPQYQTVRPQYVQPVVYQVQTQPAQAYPIEMSQNMMIGIILGLVSGLIMMVGTFSTWITQNRQYISGGPIYTDSWGISASGDFGYLYIIAIFGILILIFSLLLPFVQHVIPNPKLLSYFIMIFSLVTMILAVVGMAHISSRASGNGITIGVGPGGIACIIGGFLGLFTGYLFIKAMQKPVIVYKY